MTVVNALMSILPMMFILMFSTLMVGGVWLARQAAQKHHEEIEMRHRARQIKHRITEIAEISAVLLRYDGNKVLLQAVTEFRIQEIQRRMEYLAMTDSDGELQNAQAFMDQLEQTLAERKPLLPTTDHDIIHMKRYLYKAIKLAKIMQTKGYFLETEMVEHATRLRILMLKTEVNAYIQQARQLLKDEDRVTAAAHFKHAKEILVASNLRFPERSSMIKRISKMIWGIYATQEDQEELDAELGLTSSNPDQADWSAAEPDDNAMAEVEDVTVDQIRKQQTHAHTEDTEQG